MNATNWRPIPGRFYWRGILIATVLLGAVDFFLLTLSKQLTGGTPLNVESSGEQCSAGETRDSFECKRAPEEAWGCQEYSPQGWSFCRVTSSAPDPRT